MRAVGIVAEYNPLHLGHLRHIAATRAAFGDCAVVVCMSGDFVQRGEPAAFSKLARAEAAVRAEGGADLVIELQTPFSMSRAQRFADESVRLLAATGVVDALSFGSECGDVERLCAAADALLAPGFDEAVRDALSCGMGYAAARTQAAKRSAGGECAELLAQPNNILALEYIRALREQGCAIEPFTVLRTGARHDGGVCGGDASASAVRKMLAEGGDAARFVPRGAWEVYTAETGRGAGTVSTGSLEQAIMSQLRRMRADDFAKLPDISEGLEARLYAAARSAGCVEDVCAAAKTRRYSMARIRRIVMSAYLGIEERVAAAGAQYIRVLAMNRAGRELLAGMRKTASLPVVTKPSAALKLGPAAARLAETESLACDLYALGYQNAALRRAGEDLRSTPYVKKQE